MFQSFETSGDPSAGKERVNRLRDWLAASNLDGFLVSPVGRESQIAGGDQRVQHFRRVFTRRSPVHQLIAGQLLSQEPVVRLVLIEITACFPRRLSSLT